MAKVEMKCPKCGMDLYGSSFPHGEICPGEDYGLKIEVLSQREVLKQHWIREHLPAMAQRRSLQADDPTYEEAVAWTVELIDACLDAVCGEEKK